MSGSIRIIPPSTTPTTRKERKHGCCFPVLPLPKCLLQCCPYCWCHNNHIISFGHTMRKMIWNINTMYVVYVHVDHVLQATRNDKGRSNITSKRFLINSIHNTSTWEVQLLLNMNFLWQSYYSYTKSNT